MIMLAAALIDITLLHLFMRWEFQFQIFMFLIFQMMNAAYTIAIVISCLCGIIISENLNKLTAIHKQDHIWPSSNPINKSVTATLCVFGYMITWSLAELDENPPTRFINCYLKQCDGIIMCPVTANKMKNVIQLDKFH